MIKRTSFLTLLFFLSITLFAGFRDIKSIIKFEYEQKYDVNVVDVKDTLIDENSRNGIYMITYYRENKICIRYDYVVYLNGKVYYRIRRNKGLGNHNRVYKKLNKYLDAEQIKKVDSFFFRALAPPNY